MTERLTDFVTDTQSLEVPVRPLLSHFTSFGNKMEKARLVAVLTTKFIVTGGAYNLIIFSEKNECCGCGVCALSCATNCIEMVYDEEGFAYPKIDQEKCINCGKCRASCVFRNKKGNALTSEFPLVYAAKIKDESIRRNSTSGGAFTALSDHVLESDGIVYGVRFDERLTAITAIAKTKEERDKFRGSKYMQSDLGNSFVEIRDYLQSGKLVMFSGTPCQTAALKLYLNNIDTTNLYLIDLICMGTPPQKIFKDFIHYLEKKKNKKITEYYCRYKGDGWKRHVEKQVYSDGTEDHESIDSQIYSHLFSTKMALRPSCYNCKCKGISRESDITIADFWGIEKTMPEFDDNEGISLILLHSAKGEQLLVNIENDLSLRKSVVEECFQPMLTSSSKEPPRRKQFWTDYRSKGFEYIAKKSRKSLIEKRCKSIVKKWLLKVRTCVQ